MPLAWLAIVFGGILLVAGAKNSSLLGTALGTPDKLPGGSPSDTPTVTEPSNPGGGGVPGGVIPGGIHGLIGATDKLAKLQAACDDQAHRNYPYLWGGGHLGYSATAHKDCSGAVSYVLHAAGLHSGPPWTSGMFAAAWGDHGPGQFFTVWANVTHVFIEFADGRQWGTTQDHNPDGGMAWFTGHTTKGFTPRHYRGY